MELNALASAATNNFFFYEQTDSTNNRAKEYAEKENCHVPAVFMAETQTAGRGRLGRSFFSPEKCGIYISYLINVSDIKVDFELITPVAAVAVCRTLETFLPLEKTSSKFLCLIKWVNDILVNGKKVCGILTEGIMDSHNVRLEKVVVGIGINLNRTPDRNISGAFPSEIQKIAGTVQINVEKRRQIVEKLTETLFELLLSENSDDIMAEYKKRSAIIGSQVQVISTVGIDSGYCAKVLDITKNGHLIVQKTDETSDKKPVELFTGEVSIRANP